MDLDLNLISNSHSTDHAQLIQGHPTPATAQTTAALERLRLGREEGAEEENVFAGKPLHFSHRIVMAHTHSNATTDRSVSNGDCPLEPHNSSLNLEPMKYIVVTGGVVSGLGKGVTISSIGRMLKNCGLRTTSIKIDPYLVGAIGGFVGFLSILRFGERERRRLSTIQILDGPILECSCYCCSLYYLLQLL